MQPKYLQQQGSGHVYVWTEALAKRADMVPCDGPGQTKSEEDNQPLPTPQNEGGEPDEYDQMNKPDLLLLAKGKGLAVTPAMNKPEIIAALRAAA